MQHAYRSAAVIAVMLTVMTACQQPGQPGPMERAGSSIDQFTTRMQQGIADFSLGAGQKLDEAGKSVGSAASRAGQNLHDHFAPQDASVPAGTAQAGPPAMPSAPPAPPNAPSPYPPLY